MKIIFALLLIQAISCQATVPASNREPVLSCSSSSNAFLANIVGKNVKIYDSPQTLDAVTLNKAPNCQAEWSKYNVCCDLSSLSILNDNELSSIEKSEASLFATLNSGLNFLRQIISEVNHLVQMVPIASYKLLASSLTEAVNHKIFSEYNASSNSCFSNLKSLRKSALCHTCSGRNQMFMNNSKMLIDKSTCKTAIEQCRPYYQNVISFKQKLETVTTQANICFPATITGDFNKAIKTILSNIQAFMPSVSVTLSNNLAKYFDPALKTDQIEKDICGVIIDLRKDTLTQVFDREITKFVSSFTSAYPTVLTTLKLAVNLLIATSPSQTTTTSTTTPIIPVVTTPTIKLPFSFSRRLTTSLASSSDPFQSDAEIFMPTQDNMFSAYDGAQGTSLDHYNTNKEPMNTTMSFP